MILLTCLYYDKNVVKIHEKNSQSFPLGYVYVGVSFVIPSCVYVRTSVFTDEIAWVDPIILCMTFSCILEEFADTKDVIKIHKSKMYRQHNDLKKKNKRTNNDLQSTTQKTKDRATRITTQNRSERRISRTPSFSQNYYLLRCCNQLR